MPHKKLIIVAIIIALVGGGFYVFLTNPPAQAPSEGALSPITYQNTEYGFSFSLPDNWKEFSITTSTWEGSLNGKTIATGPIVSIRNPLWTAEKPYQDIPIMVFTLDQWNDMTADKFHIGAAPINPSELGRNTNYVFALPARYNFAYPLGVEEVEQILSTKPLQAF